MGADIKNIVVTGLLVGDDGGNMDGEFRKIANILGDRVETVTPFLAERILAGPKNGTRINWLTGGKIFARFLTAPFRKRDLFSSDS